MSASLGVGILGAGPVTQAIHLPTLTTLDDRFRVVHVMDVNADVAATVAARTGARRRPTSSSCWPTPSVAAFPGLGIGHARVAAVTDEVSSARG